MVKVRDQLPVGESVNVVDPREETRLPLSTQ